jgi:acetyl esterase/lipase
MTHDKRQYFGKLNSVRIFLLLLMLGSALCLGIPDSAVAAGSPKPKLAYKVIPRIFYVHPADLARSGQLFLPETAGLHPAVILIHGGGWTAGSNHDGGVSFLAPRLAARGWVVFNINYRLVRQGGEFPKDVQDVKDALAWLIVNAKKYRINTRKIIPVGLSAGAHLALMAAYSIKADRFPAAQYPQVPLHVKAVVGFYTPTDSSFIDFLPKKSWAYRIVFKYAGAWVKKHPHHGLLTASPVFYAHDGVPTLLVQGLADRLVPAFQATEMAAALKRNDVPVRLVLIPNAGHAFMSFADKARPVGFAALIKFLDQQCSSGEHSAGAVAVIH